MSPPPQLHVDAAHAHPAAHARRHPPQFAVSLRVSPSQPSEATALQSAKPSSHRSPQPSVTQSPVACGGDGHSVVENEVPSALHVRRSAPAPQNDAPGVHARPAQ